MDRLDAMTVFVAAVDEGSLSAAGRRLQMPLATVSRKLAELESHLGTRLVTRSTRQLALTEAGRDYLVAAREILERVDEAERGAAGVQAAPRGELIVAAPLVFGRLHVVPVVADYLARFADVNVRLMLSDRNANLLEEHIDVALRIGTLPDSGLVALRIGEIRRVTCASPAYLAARGTPAVPDELRGTFARMGGLGAELAQKCAQIIETKDAGAADRLDAQDDAVDRLHRGVFTALLSADHPYAIQTAIDVTLLSRYYERFADHAVSVARRVGFLGTGEPWDDRA